MVDSFRLFTFEGIGIKFGKEKWVVKARGDCMKEEGLFYDTQKCGFSHAYRDRGRLMIDQQVCEQEHPVMMLLTT